MSDNMKKLIREAVNILSQGSSEELLLSLNLESEMHKHKTFIEMMDGDK